MLSAPRGRAEWQDEGRHDRRQPALELDLGPVQEPPGEGHPRRLPQFADGGGGQAVCDVDDEEQSADDVLGVRDSRAGAFVRSF